MVKPITVTSVLRAKRIPYTPSVDFSFFRRDQRRLGIACKHRAVDRALDAVALHGHGDFLRHRLSHARGLMNSGIRFFRTVAIQE